jgi:hypothetical protein
LLINAVGHGLKRQCLCHTKNLKKIQGHLGRAVSSPLKPAYRGKDYSLAPGQNKMKRKRNWLSKAITFSQAISKKDRETRSQ